jgi:hypothetical protein
MDPRAVDPSDPVAPPSPPPPSEESLLRRWRRRFFYALVVAAIVHLPLTPITLLFGLAARLLHIQKAEDVDYQSALAPMDEVTVELLDPPPPPPSSDPATAAGGSGAPTTQAQIELPKGADGAKPGEAKDDDPDGTEPDQRAEAKDEPLGLADLENELATQPNVTMSIWFGPMRRSPHAPKLRALLDCGPMGIALRHAGVEALSDLDAVLAAGSKISDAATYTIAAQHHLPPARLFGAVDRLVRQHGQWLDAGAAKIAAAGAWRVVMPAGRSVVLATPVVGWQKVRALGRAPKVPASHGRAVALRLLRPSIAFDRLGIDLPERLEEMRLDVYPSSTGDVDAVVRFFDRDSATAAIDAPIVTSRVRDALSQLREAASLMSWLALFVGGARFDAPLPQPEFAADGRYVTADVRIPAAQADALLGQMAPFVCVPGGARPEGPGAHR